MASTTAPAAACRARLGMHAESRTMTAKFACPNLAGIHRRILRACPKNRRMPIVSAAKDKKEIVVGVDLGTTNSAVAVLEYTKVPTMVEDENGNTTTPSVVAFTKDGGILVGALAKRQAVLNPSNTFNSVKRFIGKKAKDVRLERRQVAYVVDEDEEGEVQLLCDYVEGGRLAPEQVSAQVLGKLFDMASERQGGSPVGKAVITVPAYFTDAQKDATLRAGMLAGVETVRIIREPNAAALAYGIGKDRDETILVFDLGGGTFDVSILEVGNGVIEVLSTGGDSALGGDDFNKQIVDFIAKQALKIGARDPRSDPRTLQQIVDAAEAAKCRLSTAQEVALTLPLVQGSDGEGLKIRLTRNLLDQLCAEELRRLRLPVEQACEQAGVDLSRAQVDRGKGKSKAKKNKAKGVATGPSNRSRLTQVILVGGATRMPSVQRFIANMTGLEPKFTVNPDEAVALGAAVQAGILNGDVSDLYVMDVWQASLMRGLAEWQQRTNFEGTLAGDVEEGEEGEEEYDEEYWGPEDLEGLEGEDDDTEDDSPVPLGYDDDMPIGRYDVK